MHAMLWRSCQANSVISNLRTREANIKVMESRGTGLLKHYGGRKIFKRYLKNKTPKTLAGGGGGWVNRPSVG